MAVTNQTGIGQDGYLQYQAETTYGTAATGSETALPIKEGSLIKAYPEAIENANIISSRLKQDVQKGRIVVDGQIVMDSWPTIMGGLINQFLGAAAGDTAVGDGAYTHHWFIPKSGVRVGKSMTIHQALGTNLADQFDGCIIDSATISQDNAGNLECTFAIRGQGYTQDVARETSLTYPVSSTNPPFMFGHASITATPSGGNEVTMCAESLSITINLNHQLDRYKICSSASGAEISQPVFNSIPTIEVSMTVDADQYLMEYARAHTQWDMTIDWTHTVSEAGTTPTYHQMSFELPGCLLAPDTEIPASNDRVTMSASFNCGYGGTTTNSGSVEYMGEVRLVDATAAYT